MAEVNTRYGPNPPTTVASSATDKVTAAVGDKSLTWITGRKANLSAVISLLPLKNACLNR